MVIYSPQGVPVISVKVDDSSYHYEEIMGDSIVVLEFSLTDHVELIPGSYIFFRGKKYELLNRTDVSIKHTRDYEYKATFNGPQSRFARYIMFNYQDGRVKFEMIATPDVLLQMVLWNLNNREPGMWSLGAYADKEARLVSFNHTTVKDALNIIAETFDTEWGVEPYGSGYRINLRKNEFNKDTPLALGYGKNQGFKPGVGRVNFGEFGQVEKVWIDGGERNLSLEEYGWTSLHFPASFAFSMDANGKLFYWVGPVWYQEDGYDSASALDFVTDEFGASVRLASAQSNCVESSLDLTEYYPKRVGTVDGVYYLYKGQYYLFSELVNIEDLDWNEVQVDIVDSSLGDGVGSLDYDEYKFSNDEPLTVIFQTGMLAGREFNATFIKEPKYRPVVDPQTGEVVIDPTTGEPEMEIERPGNRFELSRATIDGVDMPNYTYRPNAIADGGTLIQDTYIVVNCWLPEAYLRDYDNFGGAEIDALREAAKFIRENKDPQFTFKGQVDDLYSHRNWNAIQDKLIVGGCVSFQNSSIQPEPIVTRIIGIKTPVNNEFAPELTLSNETVRGGVSSKIAKLKADDEHIIESVKNARRYSQRSFRDAKETIAMLAGAIDYFSEGINPITVETMSLLVGYEALQFKFWTTRMCNVNADPVYHYDPDARIFRLDACVIQHLTLGIKEVTSKTNVQGNPVRQYYDYLRWSMAQVEFGQSYFIGTDPNTGKSRADTAYYLYAKVDSSNVAKADSAMTAEELTHIYGQFVLTSEKKVMKQKLEVSHEQDGDFYYLLVGILNSEYDGGRSFAPLFGFTEVLPGQITTDVIRSASGGSYFDLVNNQFRLGNNLIYENNELVLNGAFVQSGDRRYHLGAFRGQWTAGETYYPGDEVWWQNGGSISSYIYIYETPSIATNSNNPSNTTYWQVFAQGTIGGDGQSSFKSTIFCRTNETPIAPAGSVGSYTTPCPPTDTSWQVYKQGGTAISGVYWHDGIPDGDEMLWACTRIFTDDEQPPQQDEWTDPAQMTDTSDYDVEFALAQANDATPADPTYGTGGTIDSRGPGNNRNDGLYNSYSQASSNGVIWYDQNIDHNLSGLDWKNMVWRAERWMKNGEWGQWAVTQIKGERGAEGNGIADIEEYYAFSTSGNTPPGTWPYDEDHRPTQQELLSHTGEYLWTKTVISYTDPNVQDSVKVFAQYLPNAGEPGVNGPMLVGRGKYDCDETGEEMTSGHQVYYGDDKIRNVVWFDNGTTGRWYMTQDVRQVSGNGGRNYFSGIDPTDTDYWAPFDGSFANVATGLLFARKAYLENAIVRFLETANEGNARITAQGNNLCMYDATHPNPRLMISGDDLSVASSPLNFTFGSNQYASFQTNSYNGSVSAEMRSQGVSFNVSGDGAVLVIPDVQLDLNAGLAQYSGSGEGFVYFYIAWELTGPNGTEQWFGEGPYSGDFGRVGSYTNKQYSERITFEGGRIPISRGQYTLKLYCELMASGCGGSGTTWTFVANASPYTSYNNFAVGYPLEKTEIGANGFQVIFSATQLFKCVIDGNDVVDFLMQSDDVGIEMSSNGAGGTMWIRLGGQWYTVSKNGSGYLILTPDNNH